MTTRRPTNRSGAAVDRTHTFGSRVLVALGHHVAMVSMGGRGRELTARHS
jgi:hypothetical protein